MKCFDVFLHKDIYIGKTDSKGLAVFTSDALAKETVIEVCPVVFFDKNDQENIDKTNLYNYYFAPSFLEDPKNKAGCFAMGTMSLCNHSNKPNAKIEKITQDGVAHFVLKAIHDIEPKEEITISYGTTWFDVKD